MQNRSELPAPAPAALAHSRRVEEFIVERLTAAGGWLDFAEYMGLVLYAPGLGYYSAGAAKLGPAGDFITAPEISPLFGRCLARACAPWLRDNPDGVVMELGAGTGALAAELLAACERQGCVPRRYLVLEVSAELRERQRAMLGRLPGHLAAAVEWLDALPASPLKGIVIANEVADALPVTLFRRGVGGALLERGVAIVDGRPGWAERPASAALAAAVGAIERDLGVPLGDGYSSEVSLRLPAWIGAVAASIATGVFLVSDYGLSRREYYHPERRRGTFICHYRHRAHEDPFLHPGLQDLSAWVDFTAVAAAGAAAGLAVAGYSTQAHFLIDSGLAAELEALQSGERRADLALASQAKTLLMPGEMGERFKVMALSRGEVDIGGFGFRDLRHRL